MQEFSWLSFIPVGISEAIIYKAGVPCLSYDGEESWLRYNRALWLSYTGVFLLSYAGIPRSGICSAGVPLAELHGCAMQESRGCDVQEFPGAPPAVCWTPP